MRIPGIAAVCQWQILYNPTDIDIYVHAAGKDMILPKGETITIL